MNYLPEYCATALPSQDCFNTQTQEDALHGPPKQYRMPHLHLLLILAFDTLQLSENCMASMHIDARHPVALYSASTIAPEMAWKCEEAVDVEAIWNMGEMSTGNWGGIEGDLPKSDGGNEESVYWPKADSVHRLKELIPLSTLLQQAVGQRPSIDWVDKRADIVNAPTWNRIP